MRPQEKALMHKVYACQQKNMPLELFLPENKPWLKVYDESRSAIKHALANSIQIKKPIITQQAATTLHELKRLLVLYMIGVLLGQCYEYIYWQVLLYLSDNI